MTEESKIPIPRYISVGFGDDLNVCMFLSNSAAKIINGPTEERREPPLLGVEPVADALTLRDDLEGLPVVVRDAEARRRVEQLGFPTNTRPILQIEDLEQAAQAQTSLRPPIFERGAECRSLPQCEDSLDEARTIAGRIFYALNGLSERERAAAIKQADSSSAA